MFFQNSHPSLKNNHGSFSGANDLSRNYHLYKKTNHILLMSKEINISRESQRTMKSHTITKGSGKVEKNARAPLQFLKRGRKNTAEGRHHNKIQ